MYRRIHLSQSLSVIIRIEDPLNPVALPSIQFLGSDNEAKRQRDDISNKIDVSFIYMHNVGYNCNLLAI